MRELTETASQLHAAAVRLAAECDYAVDEDGRGFNKPDTHFGHGLAETPAELWTDEVISAAWTTLRKYKGQLQAGGIDFDAIEKPAELEAADKERRDLLRTIQLEGDKAVFHFGYSQRLVAAVKTIPGRKWDGDSKTWSVVLTTTSRPAVLEFAKEFGFKADPAIMAIEVKKVMAVRKPTASIELDGELAIIRFPYSPEAVAAVKTIPGRKWNGEKKFWTAPTGIAQVSALADFAEEFDLEIAQEITLRAACAEADKELAVTLSNATTDDFDVPNLGGTLLPFQRAGVRLAVSKGRTLIADEMGLGKTWQALATLESLEAYPALIVVPASLKLNWEREANKVVPGRTVEILSGKKPTSKPKADIVIVNYDVLSAWAPKLGGMKALVLDEAHYVKTAKAQRTKAVKKLTKGVDTVLLLTGTPLLSRPAELISPLQILGWLDYFGGWTAYVERYCNAYRDRFGWNISGAANLVELNEKLRELGMVRRMKADVLTELPAKRRSIVPLELDNRKDYEAAAADVVGWVSDLAVKDAEFLAEIADLPKEARRTAMADRRTTTEIKARYAEQLVRIEALKQVAVTGKMKGAIEWIENFIESGEKLVVFATHTAVVETIADHFNAPKIYGATSMADRQAAVDSFQDDPAVKLIVGNIKAMGVGLTLTAASNVAFLELGWTPGDHSQAEDRCHRIGQSDSVTAYYLVADKTIDGEIYNLIEAKRQIVDAATDGKEAGSVKILSELIANLKRSQA
jgi:hypothetical protein